MSPQDLQLVEVPPRADLSPWIGTLVYMRYAAQAPDRERRLIAMASSSVDLVLNLGDPFTLETFGDSFKVGNGASLIGPRPQITFVRREGELKLLIARFRNGAAAPLLPYPVKSLTGTLVDAQQLWPLEAAQACKTVSGANGPAEAVQRLEGCLAKLMSKARKPDPMTRKAVKLIAQHQGDIEVSALAKALGVSRQTVKHRFDQTLGLPPKLFGKLRRFQAVLGKLTTGSKVDWPRAAQDCGYYDQAHLIREFNHFTGFSPQKFLKNLDKGEDLYIFNSADQTHFHLADRFKRLTKAS